MAEGLTVSRVGVGRGQTERSGHNNTEDCNSLNMQYRTDYILHLSETLGRVESDYLFVMIRIKVWLWEFFFWDFSRSTFSDGNTLNVVETETTRDNAQYAI